MQNLDTPQIIIKCIEGKWIIVLNFLVREKIYSSYLIEACYCEGVKVGRNDNGDVIVIFSKEICNSEKSKPFCRAESKTLTVAFEMIIFLYL